MNERGALPAGSAPLVAGAYGHAATSPPATFPRAVEQLARKALSYPLEIVAGGRSVAADTVDQYVELRAEGTKFMRLLQLLGHWFERGSVLIFVDTQLKCDSIYEQLMKAGYPALSLHGGKDQADRDGTISDFKSGVATVLVATSVAGRGLDVPSIVCVVNYSAPNHLEDYVHRVGRTGRAGRTGTAYTFLDPNNEDVYAPIVLLFIGIRAQWLTVRIDQSCGDENHQIAFLTLFSVDTEQSTNHWDVLQNWHFVVSLLYVLTNQPTDCHGGTVVNCDVGCHSSR